MEVILLERVAKLGHMGETVKVKDGFARNFLLPRGKALRATEANKKRFEAQRAQLEARNLAARKDADAYRREACRPVGDHAAFRWRDGRALRLGRARDIVDALAAAGFTVGRQQVTINQPIKSIGLHQVPIHLHPEVEVIITANVARSPEEAEKQARGENVLIRRAGQFDDLGLEVGAALAEAGPKAEM